MRSLSSCWSTVHRLLTSALKGPNLLRDGKSSFVLAPLLTEEGVCATVPLPRPATGADVTTHLAHPAAGVAATTPLPCPVAGVIAAEPLPRPAEDYPTPFKAWHMMDGLTSSSESMRYNTSPCTGI
jgi:hypothetical protein